MTTYIQAIDAIFDLFNNSWNAVSPSIVGSAPAIRWQGIEGREPPALNSYWCRVSTQNVMERQTTYKTGVAIGENRRYTSSGLLFVQLFCPQALADAMDKGRQLAVLARDTFRGKTTSNDVWFRNARINELPPEDGFYRFNIIVEYEYDDIG